ncbi:MAG: metal ABC transporter solute-binding protein, Zn/Mn family [Nitrososphaeraceae archaeon]
MNINKISIIVIITLAILVITNTEHSYQIEENLSEQSNNLTKLKITTSFFPYYDLVSKIVGDKAELVSVIPFGSEPHDWEPSPGSIEAIQESDMIVYNGIGFDSWIKEVITESNSSNIVAIDISEGLKLLERSDEDEHHEEDSLHSAFDPHIWLDPIFMKTQIELVSKQISEIDPINSQYYSNNTATLVGKLDSLDKYIKTSLLNCELDKFIPFHDAFSYFNNRYNLTSHPVQGITPEGEILPQTIKQVIDLANELGITTLYSEDLADPRLTNTLAQEIPNSQVLSLSTLEGISDDEYSNGVGYLEKMKENVDNLKIGLKCS